MQRQREGRVGMRAAFFSVLALLSVLSLGAKSLMKQSEAQQHRRLLARPTVLTAAEVAGSLRSGAAGGPAKVQPGVVDLSQFAGVAAGVPREFPTNGAPLPEEEARGQCAMFYRKYAAMHQATLAERSDSPNFRWVLELQRCPHA